ncbi:hypothetical protein BH10PSE7_BH10PSE7_36840 [soil metagenome]
MADEVAANKYITPPVTLRVTPSPRLGRENKATPHPARMRSPPSPEEPGRESYFIVNVCVRSITAVPPRTTLTAAV